LTEGEFLVTRASTTRESPFEIEVRPLRHFHRSTTTPCPYLPDRVERKLFTRLVGSDSREMNSVLSRAGFRRSHDLIYRPVCPGCRACVPVRVPVDDFTPDRTQRRLLRRVAGFSFDERPAAATDEQFALFVAYQRARHGDSDMARMNAEDYASMVDGAHVDAVLREFRDEAGRLVGCMLVDRLEDGASAVYSFFDPDMETASLGTAMVLRLIEETARAGSPRVYLGYWIADCRKMSYKRRFRPLEGLGDDGWERID